MEEADVKKEITFPGYIWRGLEEFAAEDPDKRPPEELLLDILDGALFVPVDDGEGGEGGEQGESNPEN